MSLDLVHRLSAEIGLDGAVEHYYSRHEGFKQG